MKTATFASLLTFATAFIGSSSALPSWPSKEIIDFELRFVKSLENSYKHSNDTIKLIGYKKIKIPDNEIADFTEYFRKNPGELASLTNHHFDRKEQTLRVYFPVKDGLVMHNGRMVDGGEFGELENVKFEDMQGDCSVLGRKQTKDVTGVETNIIQDGIIYLAQPNKPTHNHDNIFVYDFGIKLVHDHSHDHSGELKPRELQTRKVSCINNHGGPNCSNKFGIKKGRCPFKSNICMDYNGKFTNCVNAGAFSYRGIRNFISSDCDYAMGRGHCWNEVM